VRQGGKGIGGGFGHGCIVAGNVGRVSLR
jgi:hypothetical protein